MSKNRPTKRENFFYGMGDPLLRELKRAFPSEFEVLIAVTKDGNIHVICEPKATFVEQNQYTGTCSVIEVPEDPCRNCANDLIGEKIKKQEVTYDSNIVKDHCEGRVGVETNAISINIFDKSHSGSSGGGYWFR